jgi:hypothetical protein
LVDAARGYCLVHDPATQTLWSQDDPDQDPRQQSAAVGLASFVARTGQPLQVDDVAQDPRYDPEADDPAGWGDERLLAVPVKVAAMNEAGAGTYLSSTLDVTSEVALGDVRVDLSVPASDDPRSAVLGWLASLRGSPIELEEYVVNSDRDGLVNPAGFVTGFVRTSVSGTAFGPGAVNQEVISAVLQANGDSWRIERIGVRPGLLFASQDDATKMLACTPSTPPSEDPIRSHVFEGLEFETTVGGFCIQIGTYTYSPHSADKISWGSAPWGDEPLWRLEPTEGDRLLWEPRIGAQLTLDPSSYWDDIVYADCYCGGHSENTGFTLQVHAITGEILRSFPGIDCSVC